MQKLDEIVAMLPMITEATIRKGRVYYWYDSLSGKLDSPLLKNARLALEELDMPEKDFRKAIKDKIYVKQVESENGSELYAYLTAPGRRVTRSDVDKANKSVGKSRKSPRFALGRPTLLGKISIPYQVDKTNVKWLQVKEPTDTKYESVTLSHLNSVLKELDINFKNPATIIMGGISYENIVSIKKHPDPQGKVDFLLYKKSGNSVRPVKGSGVSFKAPSFERYGNLNKTSKKYQKEVGQSAALEFIEKLKSAYQKLMFLNKGERPERFVGFWSSATLDEKEMKYICYGGSELKDSIESTDIATHLIIGNYNQLSLEPVSNSPDERIYQLVAPFMYRIDKQLPKDNLSPVLSSRIASKGKGNVVYYPIPGLEKVSLGWDVKIDVTIDLAPRFKIRSGYQELEKFL